MDLKGFWQSILTGVPQTSGNALVPAGGAVTYGFARDNVEYLGGQEWAEEVAAIWAGVRELTPAQMWRTQPHLRTVVGFVARNIAQLGLHTFRRVSETDRVRDRNNRFAKALANPGDGMSTYDLIFAMVGDKLLYDRAYWLPWTDKDGNDRLRRLPPSWVTPLEKSAFGVDRYRVHVPGGYVDLDASRLIIFKGYSPTSHTGCSPTLEVLKETLGEQIEATKYRAQVWKKGGRTSAVLQRPIDAPQWTDTQAERFRDDWYANYTGDGPRAGGTPILEDGMTLQRIDFSAHDMQWAEGAKLSQVTCAAAFYVNPTMIGILDNANFSNVREFRRMLYGDTLGPYLAEYEGVINTFALPYFQVPANIYAEFNIGEKLQGSFEEQASALQSSVGAPWMMRNEARAKMNLPAIEGGDEMVTPLNVLVGGQASPRDSGTQNDTGQGSTSAQDPFVKRLVRVKARADQPYVDKTAQVVNEFFKRQERAIRSRLGSKDDEDWFDDDRWDSELTTDLFALAIEVTKQVSAKTLDAIGFGPDEYDMDRTLEWLQEVSARSASSLNQGTKERIAEALQADEPTDAVNQVFENQTSRAEMIAASAVTLLSGFATHEAAKQVAGDAASKTWIAGRNARPEHAAMDGETVLLSEQFSNGASWPGDGANLGAEDLANCNCELQIDVPTGG